MPKKITIGSTGVEFFRARCLITDTGCWEWTGCQSKGYGQVRREGVKMTAHRLAYQVANPTHDLEKLDVSHTCGNSLCCNPAHLATVKRGELMIKKPSVEWVKPRERAEKKERVVIAVCKQCRNEYSSNGRTRSGKCQSCHNGVKSKPNPYIHAKPHRCGECGSKIDTKVCVRCNTLAILASEKHSFAD